MDPSASGQKPCGARWQRRGFTIGNATFEATVSVGRDDLADDRLGIYGAVFRNGAFSEMGRNARQHPEELVFGLLRSGFTTNCYDGQFFFDVDHPVVNADGVPVNVSNVQTGGGPNWFVAGYFARRAPADLAGA